MTTHRPQLVFFGAATPLQDRGLNPSHLNENTFSYWLEHFETAGYAFDAVRTARARHLLLTTDAFRRWMQKAWWYPKNILVFAPAAHQRQLDAAAVAHSAEGDMLSEFYLSAAGGGDFGAMWRRDWREFARLFYDELRRARARMASKAEL